MVRKSSVAEYYQALERHARGGPQPGAVGSAGPADLSTADLRQTGEHDVALMLMLAALCARMDGGKSIAPALRATAERYVNSSFLYTGRILPRAQELIDLLDRAVDERAPELLAEAADHLSQGWADYSQSVFPAAFARLAEGLGLGLTQEDFSEVSFVLWKQGLAAAAADDAERALPCFEASLDRYRTYGYYADAAWLHTDVVINHLLAGRMEQAVASAEAQRDYVAEVLAAHPPVESAEGEPYAFHLGDVRSGNYGTFVESSTLRPRALTSRDRDLLNRYVRTTDFLIAACRYGGRRDFDAALDVFSHGWTTYQTSPYPRIFLRLADRYMNNRHAWNVHLTAYEEWHRMLRGYRARMKPHTLIDTAATLHDRFVYAGLGTYAAIVLLDTAILHARLHGRHDAVEWVARYLRELRPLVPDLLSAVGDYLQAPEGWEGQRPLSRYTRLRAAHLVPDLFNIGLDDTAAPDLDRIEVVLYGLLLSLDGITVYENTPQSLIDILRVLGDDLMRNRPGQEGEAPFLAATELSERTNRTIAAIAQTVRRFRNACKEIFQEVAECEPIPDAVIQGRPGYRMNPATVQRFVEYPFDA
ncbi:hypothetical protein [Streptomyces sp. TRM68367]|uniref:hypothetical protein n=1 Tax=Streptomyces sp. TRM68367 TaxID=2758415 RepID=UPI00165C4051|nr:hypothetical protein [Streptomyces sp. TRM68367]MBC9726528.1 hypothetical protein [Streptomyces sp. TRM68367]